MIISSDDVRLDLSIDSNVHENITLNEFESFLRPLKENFSKSLKAKEMKIIPYVYAYFSNDLDKNKFVCKVYKTSTGPDVWLLLMADDIEGYALYENPLTNKLELAWYNVNLDEPLSEEEESKFITCYVP